MSMAASDSLLVSSMSGHWSFFWAVSNSSPGSHAGIVASAGRFLAEGVTEFGHQGIAAKIHRGFVFVRGLVVTVLDVVLRLRLPPRDVVVFVFHAFVDGERGNADAAEAEMVGAVIVAGFGSRVRPNRQIELLRGFFHRRIEGGSLRADDFHFLGNTDGRQIVIVQIENRLRRKLRGMLAQIFGAEQSLFFRSDSCEKNGTRRSRLGCCPDATEFEQDAAAGRVVRGTVINVRAGRLGFVDAEMVVVRGIQNGFAFLDGSEPWTMPRTLREVNG